jgi:hypothetical protein
MSAFPIYLDGIPIYVPTRPSRPWTFPDYDTGRSPFQGSRRCSIPNTEEDHQHDIEETAEAFEET